jgi:hypothetical protein
MRKLRIIKFVVYAAAVRSGRIDLFLHCRLPLQFFVGWLFKSITDWGWKVLSEPPITFEEINRADKELLERLKRKEEVSNG